MFFNRLIAEDINIAPIIIVAIENTVIAMMTTDSSLSDVEIAAAAHTREFVIQIIVTVVAAIAVAYFSFRSWNAGNKLQDAIKQDAEARIEEARTQAATANEAVAEANKEIARLNTETARANVQTKEVSLKVEEESRRRLEAERALLELQALIEPRYLAAKQEAQLTDALRTSPVKGNVRVHTVLGDHEGNTFAAQIDNIVKKAGWPTSGIDQSIFKSPPPKGVLILVRDPKNPPKHAEILHRIFLSFVKDVVGGYNSELSSDTVEIRIGIKPLSR
jgi:cell division protein FtsB